MKSFEATRPSLKKATPYILFRRTTCPSTLGASKLFTSMGLTTSLNSRTCSPAMADCPRAQTSTVKTTAAGVCLDICLLLLLTGRNDQDAPRLPSTQQRRKFCEIGRAHV